VRHVVAPSASPAAGSASFPVSGPEAFPVSGPEALHVIVDRHDDPAWTATALRAHDPAAGRVTVHPTPAAGGAAALAQDVLCALGKTLPPAGRDHGAWADALRPAWNAACAWVVASGVRHVIVLRGHHLTAGRLRQLLDLRTRTGVRVTVVWHAPPGRVLGAFVRGVEHRIVEDLDQARAVLAWPQKSNRATGERSLAGGRGDPDRGRDEERVWITPARPTPGIVVPRAARTVCAGAGGALSVPDAGCGGAGEGSAENGRAGRDASIERLAGRLHTRVAHPTHAAALAVAVVTGTDVRRLALIRGIDITPDASTVKTHDSRAHRVCRVWAVPRWARDLLHAAVAHQAFEGGDPGGAVFPLIGVRDGADLRAYAHEIHLELTPTREPTNRGAEHQGRGAVPTDGTPVISICVKPTRSSIKSAGTVSASDVSEPTPGVKPLHQPDAQLERMPARPAAQNGGSSAEAP